jgi:hypothetical protein
MVLVTALSRLKGKRMKGIIFTSFNDMVEQKIGIAVWEQLLDAVKPESEGVYTSIEDFPDGELLEMLWELSTITGTPVFELLKAFGQFLFHTLAVKHSVFVEAEPDFLSFLKSIEDVIHKEVKKLYPNPNLPSLKWEQPDERSLIIYYRSPRKLCHLADGLIKGAAEQYKVDYELEHDPCMHDGSDHCRLTIKLK